MRRKIILPFIVSCIILTAYACQSNEKDITKSTSQITTEANDLEYTMYTDESFNIPNMLGTDKKVKATLSGVGKIKENVFSSEEQGEAKINYSYEDNGMTHMGTYKITVKDPATRQKDRFYNKGDITNENGKKVFTDNSGNRYVSDIYIETERGIIDFKELTGDTPKSIEFIVGSDNFFEKINETEISFKGKGDGVFKLITQSGQKLVLVHSWCDCGN